MPETLVEQMAIAMICVARTSAAADDDLIREAAAAALPIALAAAVKVAQDVRAEAVALADDGAAFGLMQQRVIAADSIIVGIRKLGGVDA